MKKATAREVIPTAPGTPFGGGFLAFRYFLGAQARALIVAGQEHELEMAWNDSIKNVKGALSYIDGMSNTLAMAKAGSKLANKTCALRIGGFDDWYLMSRFEGFGAFGALQGVKAFARGGAEAFNLDRSYWTSTQSASYSDYAWLRYFLYGGQDLYLKSVQLLARPVRSIPI